MTFDSHRDLAIPRVDTLALDRSCPRDARRCYDLAEQSNFQARKLSVSNQLRLDYPRAIKAAG